MEEEDSQKEVITDDAFEEQKESLLQDIAEVN
jgi:hypothetical protein